MLLSDTCDIYLPDSSTLVKKMVSARFNPMGVRERLQFTAISAAPLCTVWLPAGLLASVDDGYRLWWREKKNWWTVRGTPVEAGSGTPAYLEMLAERTVVDGLFSEMTGRPLMVQIAGATDVTAVRLEVSSEPDFSRLLLDVHSGVNPAGWYYVSGSVWSPIPITGLPSAATQTVGYLPRPPLPSGGSFVRWTPYIGSTPATPILSAGGYV